METTETPMIETFEHGIYTIKKDFERLTVLITRKSPRSYLGLKIVHNYSFKSTDISRSVMRLNLFVDNFIKDVDAKEASKVEEKSKLAEARKNFVNPFKLGDIFYESYGYEQTNVKFYQVTQVKGKTLTLREVAQERTYSTSMSGNTVAVKDSFLDEKELKRIIQTRLNDGKPYHSIDFIHWDERPKYWSSYY